MSKVDLAKVLIENEWYNKTLSFIAKAYKIDDATLQLMINGTQPTINDEILKKYEDKVDEILNAKDEEPKKEVKDGDKK